MRKIISLGERIALELRSLYRQRRREAFERDSLQMLVNNSDEAVFRFGVDGQARYISPSVELLYGCSAAEIYAMGGNVIENGFIHEEDVDTIAKTVNGHFSGRLQRTKLEFRIKRRDGNILWVETRCSTVIDEKSGKPTDIVFTMRDISDKRALEDRLKALAHVDGLTGIHNRRAFDQALVKAWQESSRQGRSLTVMLIDVDHFKPYNDTYGHLAGDDCLRTIATLIESEASKVSGHTARYGGEEFVVILQNIDHEKAIKTGEQIRIAVEKLAIPHAKSKASPVVTVCIGIATVEPSKILSTAESSGLLKAADAELYRAKSSGRNRVREIVLASDGVAVKEAA